MPPGKSLLERLRLSLEAAATVLVVVAAFVLYRLIVPQPVVRAGAGRPTTAGSRPEAPLPTEPLSLDEAAVKGDPDAPVAIVAFSDFQCPYCRVFAQTTWPDIQRELVDTGKVRFLFRHLPLDSIHPKARMLGTSAECSRRQGKFWEFHDYLFLRQKDLPLAEPAELGGAVGMDAAAFAACLASDAADTVQADSATASRLGVQGTPTFFIGRVENGRLRATSRLVGAAAFASFEKAVSEAQEHKP